MMRSPEQAKSSLDPHSGLGFHLVKGDERSILLEVDSGKMILLSNVQANAIQSSLVVGDLQRAELMALIAGVSFHQSADLIIPKKVQVHSFSLAIAQKCNLACTYCYAEQGTFGGHPNNMFFEVAKSSVDRLFQDTEDNQDLTFAFMGGEPLFNRETLHKTAIYAAQRAKILNRTVNFAVTTNGTLIRKEDVELFQKYNFTVTLSIDGIDDDHNNLRSYVSGKGSFENIKDKLKLLFGISDRQFQVVARVTVTPENLDLTKTFLGLLELGFDRVQFSPMLKSPNGKAEMRNEDFDVLLTQLINCGELFKASFLRKRILPLQNVLSTLKRIHNYEREAYPCGAGGGYMGVSANGKLYACHRFVNDEQGYMGDVQNGVDTRQQEVWLKDRHISSQTPCNTCWARNLCGGSCHHEVINRGRPACNYIRGWLEYCIKIYYDLMETDPNGFMQLLGNSVVLTETDDGSGVN